MRTPHVNVHLAYGWDKFELRMGFTSSEDGHSYVVQPVTISEHPRGAEVKPSMVLESGECQAMMDALYASGFRPTETRDIRGVVRATEAHLADMQKIAFKLLDQQ